MASNQMIRMATYPYENWMASCPAVDTLTPLKFCFPGTHDSGAYQKPNFDPVVSNEWMATSDIRFLPVFQEVAARWADAQPGCCIYTQLMNGVRFLDLRVAHTVYQKTPQYFLVHTFAISKLEDVLSDIKRFVQAHPTELILMKVTNKYQCNDLDLMKVFQDALGGFFYPNTNGGNITETVSAILKQGKRIVAAYRTSGSMYSDLWFNAGDILYSFPFVSKDTVAQKQAYLIQQLKKFANTKFPHSMVFQLSYTLTELPIDVAESVFSGESLAELADKMNPTLMPFVKNSLTSAERDLVGIITVDNENFSNVVDVAIALNAERLAKRKYGADPDPTPQCVVACAASGGARNRRNRPLSERLKGFCCIGGIEETDTEPFTLLLPPDPATESASKASRLLPDLW